MQRNVTPLDEEQAGRDESNKSLQKASTFSHEYNVLCSIFVLVCGPVLDALCALPGAVLDDVPSSLRTSSLVLVVLLGSPAILPDLSFVLEQRAFIAILLASCAFIGLNQAGVSARNSDAVFSLVGTLASIVASRTNGVMEQTEDEKKSMRENLSSFCGALFFYLGIRTVRHSFALSSEIIEFKISHEDIRVRGYGVSNDMVVVGNAFSGSCCVAFGCICLLNHDLILHVGSAAMSQIAAIMSCFVFLGAFLAQIASFASMERLPALFSDAACNGGMSECAAAYRARRMFTSSNSTSVAWTCSIALAVYSFSHQRRTRTRKDHFHSRVDIYSSESIVLVLGCIFACIVVAFFVDPTRSMDWADIELLLLLVSIPLCILGLPLVSCVLHIAGQVLYVWTRIELHGYYDFTYFTHHSLLATLVFTVFCAFLSTFSYILYATSTRRLYSDPVEKANALFLTALVSVQTFLTLATLGMSAGYTGVLYRDGKGSWRITGYEFTTQHCVSFFFVAAFFATRYEHNTLSITVRRAAWFIFPPLLGLTWLICISAGAAPSGSPYSAYVDEVSFLIGISAAVVSWVGIGVFLHV
jgi:hypothetical protein